MIKQKRLKKRKEAGGVFSDTASTFRKKLSTVKKFFSTTNASRVQPYLTTEEEEGYITEKAPDALDDITFSLREEPLNRLSSSGKLPKLAENITIDDTFCNRYSENNVIENTTIKTKRLCKHYFKIFEKKSHYLYFSDLYLLLLLIKANNPRLIERDIYDENVYRRISEHDNVSFNINGKDLTEHNNTMIPWLESIIEYFFNVKLINFKFKPLFTYNEDYKEDHKESFENMYDICKKNKHNTDIEIKFVISLLIRNNINIDKYNEEDLLQTVLKLFNEGKEITEKNIDDELVTSVRPFYGGKNKKPLYKLTSKKVKLLYKNKKIVRSVYLKIKNNKEYCKINKKYILLFKLVKI